MMKTVFGGSASIAFAKAEIGDILIDFVWSPLRTWTPTDFDVCSKNACFGTRLATGLNARKYRSHLTGSF
jgi:hypothetical protein